MNQHIKNMFLGIFILSGISLLVTTIMFLKPTIGDGKQTLFVRFSNINNLTVGTRVLFAGRPIGEVVSIEEIRDARKQPTDELGRVYFYQLTLHVDSKVRIFNTDEISIQTSGLLGEKSIAVTPKAPPKGVTPKLVADHPIYADSVDPLQNALLDFSELAGHMENTFQQLSEWIHDHGDAVATTIRSAGTAMEEMEQAVAAYNQTDIIQNLKNTSVSIEQLTQDLTDSKGTLGKLINDRDLYLQVNAMMNKANTLMNDINQYGIIFHLNKQWQRTHLRRMDELSALKTPQNFKDYFQQEVDDINSSMVRISMLINKAEESHERETILKSGQFKRDFSELMQKANELSDNLRLYNEQLSDALEK